jgi:hypothetical protein
VQVLFLAFLQAKYKRTGDVVETLEERTRPEGYTFRA